MDALTISVEAERRWLLVIGQLIGMSIAIRERDLWAPTKKARRP